MQELARSRVPRIIIRCLAMTGLGAPGAICAGYTDLWKSNVGFIERLARSIVRDEVGLVQTRTSNPAGQKSELIKPHIEDVIRVLDGAPVELAGMARYHLGLVDTSFEPVEQGSVDQGKRLRPSIAILACQAAGGDPANAAPLATAIEILHNFTLVHDDIQDRSELRRHRPTVWSIWGEAQAINAGDALFAASHLALYTLRERNLDAALILELADAFDRMTIEIVRGQVLDLNFEGSETVTASDYIEMIRCKTAAIVRFAAWAGSLLGGADRPRADRFGIFGESLGIGFQIRDDLLGIWGTQHLTGKSQADDIRRRKQTLPMLLLQERLSQSERQALRAIYAADEVEPTGIETVLELMDTYRIRAITEQIILEYHNVAASALEEALASELTPAAAALAQLVEVMANRTG
jgi:geranylgeranyl diphosphate synthase, type I